MLRRPPTALPLTKDDVEDMRRSTEQMDTGKAKLPNKQAEALGSPRRTKKERDAFDESNA